VNIGNTSKLVVTSVGAVQAGKQWLIINATSIPNDFAAANKDFTRAVGILSSGPTADGLWYQLGS
jgi:hypothetical protein